MKKKSSIYLIICAAWIAMPVLAQERTKSQHWVTVKPKSGHFEVSMPSQPKYKVDEIGDSDPKETYFRWAALGRGGFFNLYYYDSRNRTPKELLAFVITALKKSGALNISSTRDLTLRGSPGVEIKGKRPNGDQVTRRLFASRHAEIPGEVRLYSLDFTQIDPRHPTNDAQKFFGSFKLL